MAGSKYSSDLKEKAFFIGMNCEAIQILSND